MSTICFQNLLPATVLLCLISKKNGKETLIKEA